MTDYLDLYLSPLPGILEDEMKLTEEQISFLKDVEKGLIPKKLPDCVQGDNFSHFILHRELCEVGYYAKVTRIFCEEIRKKVGKNSVVLDPFAGRGYLGRGLRQAGLSVISTDNNSWKLSRGIEELDYKESVKKYLPGADLLALSWLPFDNDFDVEFLKSLSKDYPNKKLLVIGEPYGCTGTDEFWRLLEDLYDVEPLSSYRTVCSSVRDEAGIYSLKV